MNNLNNWSITDNPIKAKVGAKEFNFTLNDKAFDTDGSYDANNLDSIFPNNNLPLVYTSEVAPQKNAITEAMANVVFTIDWDEAIELNATHEPNIYDIAVTLNSLKGNIEFRNSTEVPATYDRATDVSAAKDNSVMAYITGQDAIVQADGGVLAPVDSNSMFQSYSAKSLDLRGLDTSQTTNMHRMFTTCGNLTTLNISSFDISKVESLARMFAECQSLRVLDLSNFNIPIYANNMPEMFYNCSNLTVYARTQEDANKMNASSYKPDTVNIVVKQ